MPQAAMTTEVKKKAMPSIKHDDNGQLEVGRIIGNGKFIIQ